MSKALTPKKEKQSTLRRVLKYVGRYPFSLCGTILFAIVTVAATLCVPVYVIFLPKDRK